MRKIKLGADGFPTRGLSDKRAAEWLAANSDGSPRFVADFWWSQSDAFRRTSGRWLIVALVCLGLSVVLQVTALTIRLVQS